MTQFLSGFAGAVSYSQAAVGELVNLPIYQLLSGKYRGEVRIYRDCHAGAHLDKGQSKPLVAYDYAAEAVIGEGFDGLKFDLDVAAGDADTAIRRLSNAAVQHKVNMTVGRARGLSSQQKRTFR
ncbi:hypothetical protein GCM10009066_18060 [Halarchaeum salinum]|uniref:Uncharacterized protein n=1 Tax=Halarchaeum salinum TaxID=489912 RepID=A0AAV3S9D0_9EURY